MFQSAVLVVWQTDRQVQQGLSYEGPAFDTFEQALEDAQRQSEKHPPKNSVSSLQLCVGLIRNEHVGEIDTTVLSGAVFEPGPTGRTALMTKPTFTKLANWLSST